MTGAELRAREIAEADRLADVAQAAGAGCVTASTIAASRKALAVAQAQAGADVINTSAADLRSLRTDPGLLAAMTADTATASVLLTGLIPDWIAAGWRYEADGQALIMKEHGGVLLHVELSDQDRADLADYPIQGHGATELAAHNVRVLRFDLEGAVAQCLTNSQPDAILAALGLVGQQNGNRWANLCRESFFAGCQAARLDIGAVLTGAKG